MAGPIHWSYVWLSTAWRKVTVPLPSASICTYSSWVFTVTCGVGGVEEVRPVLEAAVRDKAIRCAGSSDPTVASAVGVGGLNETTRKAVRVEGGYLVSGRSAFNTLSVAADLIGTTAHYDDPEKGPMVVSFTVPTTSPGIHIRDNWDTMGIRASASNDIIWEEVYVPDQTALLRPTRTWTVFNNLFSSWFNTSVPSVYLGVAQAARDYAVAGSGDRTQYPYQQPNKHSLAYQLQAAEMEVPLRTALGMMRYTAGLVEDAEARTDPPLAETSCPASGSSPRQQWRSWTGRCA